VQVAKVAFFVGVKQFTKKSKVFNNYWSNHFFALTLHPDDEGDGRDEFQGAPVRLPSNSQSTPIPGKRNTRMG
jgi:hypothetical protein